MIVDSSKFPVFLVFERIMSCYVRIFLLKHGSFTLLWWTAQKYCLLNIHQWPRLTTPNLSWPFLTLSVPASPRLTSVDLVWLWLTFLNSDDLNRLNLIFIWPHLFLADFLWPNLNFPDLSWPCLKPRLTMPDLVWPRLSSSDLAWPLRSVLYLVWVFSIF